VVIALLISSMPARAETRGYVISWFATATHSEDYKSNCPKDENSGVISYLTRIFQEAGYSEKEAKEIAAETGTNSKRWGEALVKAHNRARVNGKPVSADNAPEAAPNPHIETVVGKYAYGFDLDGKTKADDFEDPDTHQKIDNQLWRAVGCTQPYRTVPPAKPFTEDFHWNIFVDSAPAWAIQIEAKNLSSDGAVTITLDRATQHLERDANGNILTNATYILDPSPRSHNVLSGEIKNGVLTTKPADIHLEGEAPYYSEIGLRKGRMRINMQPDGTLVGYWGGYLNWTKYVYTITGRLDIEKDSIGIYYALKEMADFDPDPKTGQNRYISGTFRMEAVPAFLARPNGQIVASAARAPGEPGKVAANTAAKTSALSK
jgi:hypothetical protein